MHKAVVESGGPVQEGKQSRRHLRNSLPSSPPWSSLRWVPRLQSSNFRIFESFQRECVRLRSGATLLASPLPPPLHKLPRAQVVAPGALDFLLAVPSHRAFLSETPDAAQVSECSSGPACPPPLLRLPLLSCSGCRRCCRRRAQASLGCRKQAPDGVH